jgi:hypothetical protein
MIWSEEIKYLPAIIFENKICQWQQLQNKLVQWTRSPRISKQSHYAIYLELSQTCSLPLFSATHNYICGSSFKSHRQQLHILFVHPKIYFILNLSILNPLCSLFLFNDLNSDFKIGEYLRLFRGRFLFFCQSISDQYFRK